MGEDHIHKAVVSTLYGVLMSFVLITCALLLVQIVVGMQHGIFVRPVGIFSMALADGTEILNAFVGIPFAVLFLLAVRHWATSDIARSVLFATSVLLALEFMVALFAGGKYDSFILAAIMFALSAMILSAAKAKVREDFFRKEFVVWCACAFLAYVGIQFAYV